MNPDEFKKAYESLPSVIRQSIKDSNWENSLSVILKNNNLRIDQVAIIENNAVMAMVGLLSVSDFAESLKNEAEISDTSVINGILGDVEENIFAKIRQKVMEETSSFDKETDNTKAPLNKPVSETPDRDSLLKEIEDKEEDTPAPVADLSIPEISAPKNYVAPSVQNVSANMNTSTDSKNPSVAQKLTTPSTTETKTVKFDPYREIPE